MTTGTATGTPRVDFDFIVIGAGIAGASAGYFLAAEGRVLVLEMEDQPGYHSTGRSAALFTEAYGSDTIRALARGGRAFFENPPAGFADNPLLTPRGALFVGRAEQAAALATQAEQAAALVDGIRQLDAAEAQKLVPVLRPEYAAGAVLEPGARDVDVHALHQGFLRGLSKLGGEVVNRAEVTELGHDGQWTVTARTGSYGAGIVINAAGAWCDHVGALAGARPISLVPKRRTAILFDAPAGAMVDDWPFCVDIDESFYFRPDAGRLIGSPADETPVEPCDVQPEDIDVAIAVDRLESATTLTIGRIERRWAGLRSFVADKTPVVGFDAEVAGFFWLAGQGGYGIKTSPALGRLTAALALDREVPQDLQDLGVRAEQLAPARLRQ